MASELTAERLREVLHYNPDTGVFTRLVASRHNARFVGSEAGRTQGIGYREIRVDGRRYLAHRLAWLYMTGAWPKAETDHTNLDRADNRWCNLREATRSQNFANKRLQANNTSGRKGIRRQPSGKWRAEHKFNGKPIRLGLFDTPGQAALAHAISMERHHGAFARPTLEDVSLDIFMTAWREARWKFDWVSV
jgi:hypothetical protein